MRMNSKVVKKNLALAYHPGVIGQSYLKFAIIASIASFDLASAR